MFFKQIIGHDEIKGQLVDQVASGRVPHAQLFSGAGGSGKFPMALAFARYLLCSQPNGTDACGVCPSCKKIDKLAHPDLHFVFPVVKPKGKKVVVSDDYLPEWRTMVSSHPYFDMTHWLSAMNAENQQAMIYVDESDQIQRKLSLKSCEGGRKVMLIWLPEKMNIGCANKLLKLFEEPPAETVFLMVSEAPEQLLTTIVSRTQPVYFKQLPDAVLCQALMERNGLGQVDAEHITHLSNGNYLKALEAITFSQESELFLDLFITLMRMSYQRKIKDMKQWSDKVAGLGRERQKSFLMYCQRLVRENFMYNFQRPELLYMTAQEENFSKNFARFVNERNVIPIMDELSSAQRDIEQNTNPRMVFFDFALKMIVMLIQ